MAIPSTGAVSLSTVQTEFGGANPISLSEYYRNGGYVTSNNPGVPLSGQISLGQFRGTTKQFIYIVSQNYSTPQNLRALAVAAGWNQVDFLQVTNNLFFSSNTTASPALTIDGSFPNGLLFVNNGTITGMGGKGGDTLVAGSPGGAALSVSIPVTIQNNGTIAGGGGGGGAGAYWVWNGLNRSTPGSGGASGMQPAAGGGGGPNAQGLPSTDSNADGLYETPGASNNWGWGGRASSPGGKGGNYGAAGDAGGTVDGVYNYTGYAGGAGGAAVVGNGNVTWTATGFRYGALS